MKKIIIIHTLLLFTLGVTAQDDLINDNIEVIKTYDADLSELNHIETEPQQINLESPYFDYRYNSTLESIPIEYPKPYIRPIAHSIEPEESVPQGYLLGKFGNLDIPFIHGGYDLFNTDYYQLGFEGRYENYRNDYNFKSYGGNVHADYFVTKDLKLNLKLDYDQSQLDNTIEDSLQRKITTFDGISRLQYQTNNFDIGAMVSYTSGKLDLYDLRENRLRISPFVAYRISNALSFGVQGFSDVSEYNNDEDLASVNMYLVNPYVETSSKSFNLEAGIQYFYQKDVKGKLYPRATLRWSLQNSLSTHITLAIDNEFKRNSLLDINSTTPRISTDVLQDADIRYENHYSAQISSSLPNSNTSIKIGGGYKKMTNDINYQTTVGVRDTTDTNYLFNYSKIDYSSIYGLMEISIPILEKLQMTTDLRYDHFDNDSTLYLRPAFQGSLTLDYNPIKNVNVQPSVYASSAFKLNGEAENSVPFLTQLNLKIGYEINNTFEFQAEGLNLLDKNLLSQYQYRAFERQLNVGLLITF